MLDTEFKQSRATPDTMAEDLARLRELAAWVPPVLESEVRRAKGLANAWSGSNGPVRDWRDWCSDAVLGLMAAAEAAGLGRWE